MSVLIESPLPNRTYRGKVRDTYDLGDRMLIVATDRLSAFDATLRTGFPGRGKHRPQRLSFVPPTVSDARTEICGVDSRRMNSVGSVTSSGVSSGSFMSAIKILMASVAAARLCT